MANSVTTTAARIKFAKAHGGDKPLPQITHIAWGDGGHDAQGQPIPPAADATIVPGEILKKTIDGHSYPAQTTLKILGSLVESEGNGKNISACGLYDSEETLVALKTFTPKGKDIDTRLEIEWDEEF